LLRNIYWVKEYLYRPGQDLRASAGARQSAHEGGKIVSPTHRLRLLGKRYPWRSVLNAESTPAPWSGQKD